ncbi:hypothetical protein PIB30_030924 [Stylosanthes scabra]|uniref:F-box domain-containing protein n=1 Tax=Stylosanthes scabra TaxID=79078 RepID=A0ABU6QB52_9FABA|nr:hypothetical protein [Stylosanthes scabra]
MERISHHIPSEIMTIFFVKLDSRTFAKCRSLSKFWYNTLKDPLIVSSHLSLEYGTAILLHLRDPLLDFSLGTVWLYDLTFKKEVNIPPPTTWRGLQLIGSADGYILANFFAEKRSSCKLILWNPITQLHRFIEEPSVIQNRGYPPHNHACIYSFYRIPNTNSFGTMLLLKYLSNDRGYKMFFFKSCYPKTIFGLNLTTLTWSECVIPQVLNNVYKSCLIAQKERLMYLSMDLNSPQNHIILTQLVVSDGRIILWEATKCLHTNNFYYTPNIMVKEILIGIDRTMSNLSLSANNQNRLTTLAFTTIDTNTGAQINRGSLSRNSIIGVIESFLFEPRLDDNIGFI